MAHENWNWEDGTPEDGPRLNPPADPNPAGPMTEESRAYYHDLLAKHDELAKMVGFANADQLQWMEEALGEEPVSHIYAWDISTSNFHEIRIERVEATTDSCLIRFNRGSDDLNINFTWTQEA